MKISGAIFDMDGTLLDSMGMWDNVAHDYLESKKITPPWDLKEQMKTKSLEDAAVYFQQTLGFTQTAEEIIDEINLVVEKKYEHSIPLKDGVMPLLQSFKRKGIQMCVATATDEHLAKMALERLGIAKFFSFVITGREAGMGKENPKIFLDAMERLSTNKEETLIFEDAFYAIKTAKEAGFPVVAVYDFMEKEPESKIRQWADYYVKRLDSLSEAW